MKRMFRRMTAMALALALLAMGPSALAEVLKNGSKGASVLALQQALERLGYVTGGADGVYGSQTAQAVRAFQRNNGLKADGKAGDETQALLYRLAFSGASEPTAAPATPVPAVTAPPSVAGGTAYFGGDYTAIRPGDRGTRVRLLQLALNALGYSCGAVDGDYGTATSRAVKALQGAYGLGVDGKAGKLTLTLIESLLTVNSQPAIPTTVPTAVPTAAPTAIPTAVPSASGAIPTRTLYPGYSGDDVSSVQTRLSALGYYSQAVSGYYDEVTRGAVLLFQRFNGLSADGVAGKQTCAALFSDYAVAYAQALPTAAPTAIPTAVPTAVPEQTIIPTRTLRRGYTGADVLSVQTRLQALGYYAGALNSTYDDATVSAVKAFQKRNGLYVDGLAGSDTNRCLFSATALAAAAAATAAPTSAPTPVPTAVPADTVVIPTRTLYYGNTGADVLSVQRRLQALGYYTGPLNSTYDSLTIEAVRAFQRKNSLSADGLAGPKTCQALYSATAIGAGSQAPDTAPTAQPTDKPNTHTTLKKGDASMDVAQMQARLALLGYVTATVGRYDNATVTAVKTFQQTNGLKADGIAGPETLMMLYSAAAKAGPSGAWTGTAGTGPAKSAIKLLHWQNEIKNTLSNKQIIVAYDPVTGIKWNLQILSRGRHCDVEPATAYDTAAQTRAFGNREDWGPKPVYIQLPGGQWTMATITGVAHGTNTISNNNYNGQNCVHFLRDMSEAKANDPQWGVQNQEVLRESWKYLTGESIP